MWNPFKKSYRIEEFKNQNGKGDTPRKVVRQTYEHNHETIFARRKTIKQWRDHFGHNLLDYEGFNGYWFDSLLTEEEYLNCSKACIHG